MLAGNRLLVLSFESEEQMKSYKRYNLLTVDIKNVMIDGQNFFDQPVRNNITTYNSIQKTATGQGDDYTNGCLLKYDYFKNYYKMIAIDLRKQQVVDANPKSIQQINFTGNLERQATMFFII